MALNQEQVKSGMRWAASFAGGIAVGRGWIKADTVSALLANEAVWGFAASLAMGGWAILARSNKNLVVAAEAVEAVAKVIVKPTAEGQQIVAATGPKVVTTDHPTASTPPR